MSCCGERRRYEFQPPAKEKSALESFDGCIVRGLLGPKTEIPVQSIAANVQGKRSSCFQEFTLCGCYSP
jgi:hypothetical protein